MFTLLNLLPVRRILLEQFPAIVISIIIAEIWYKLGSFSLEVLAFLVTWGIVDFLFQKIKLLTMK